MFKHITVLKNIYLRNNLRTELSTKRLFFVINLEQTQTLSIKLKGMTSTLFQMTVFADLCVVTWPVNKSEARVGLVLIETLLLFLC